MLSLIVPLASANALYTENVSITETGGVVVSGGASASGTSDADASVHSVIRSTGSNTNVQVDIRTVSNGEEYATTVSRTIPADVSVDVTVPRETGTEAGVQTEVVISTENTPVFERFAKFLDSFFRFLVFW